MAALGEYLSTIFISLLILSTILLYASTKVQKLFILNISFLPILLIILLLINNYNITLENGCQLLVVPLYGDSLETLSIPYDYIWVMYLIFIISIYYATIMQYERLNVFFFQTAISIITGIMLISVKTFFAMIMFYELTSVITIWMIFSAAKTSKIADAAKYMIIWTQFGAGCLMLAWVVYGFADSSITIVQFFTTSTWFKEILIFIAFGVKLPLWPWCWWLSEVHVEVGTHYSIVLSGIIIKLALICYLNIAAHFMYINTLITLLIIIGSILLLIRAAGSNDIKQNVAYATIGEINITSNGLNVIGSHHAVLFFVTVHAFISSLQFILVDILTRRYHTRNIVSLRGVGLFSPLSVKLLFFSVLQYSALPGFSIFTNEVFYAGLLILSGLEELVQMIFFNTIQTTLRDVWQTIFTGNRDGLRQVEVFQLTRAEVRLILFILLIMSAAIPLAVLIYDWLGLPSFK